MPFPGQAADTPGGAVHAGCSVDTPVLELLQEVRAWLDQPANADEVLLLYLENVLDVLRNGVDSAMLGLGRRTLAELDPSDVVVPDGFSDAARQAEATD